MLWLLRGLLPGGWRETPRRTARRRSFPAGRQSCGRFPPLLLPSQRSPVQLDEVLIPAQRVRSLVIDAYAPGFQSVPYLRRPLQDGYGTIEILGYLVKAEMVVSLLNPALLVINDSGSGEIRNDGGYIAD